MSRNDHALFLMERSQIRPSRTRPEQFECKHVGLLSLNQTDAQESNYEAPGHGAIHRPDRGANDCCKRGRECYQFFAPYGVSPANQQFLRKESATVLALPIANRCAIHFSVIVVSSPQKSRHAHLARVAFAPPRQLLPCPPQVFKFGFQQSFRPGFTRFLAFPAAVMRPESVVHPRQ